MSRWIVRLFFLLASFSEVSAADSTQVKAAPAPDWVRERSTADFDSAAEETGPHGIHYLLVDRQTQAETQESYSRLAYKVTSSSGLQNASQVSFSFDPAYQFIDLHTLVVWRNGRSDNRLSLEKMQILQQERDLERHQYNGQLTALFLLEDVRVGDVIEYAYTRRGENPIFAHHYLDLQATSWGSAIREQWVRLLVASDRHLAHQQLGGSPLTSTVRAEGSLLEYEWAAKNQKAAEFEATAPSWYLPFSILEISDFENWEGVVDWALPLYSPTVLSDSLRAKAREITAGLTSDRDRAVAILDFVQREIRYLGIELGLRSHAPSEPDQTFRLRYGDCKDKVRLLCALLNEVGISAAPALTHSRFGKKLGDRLPGIAVFDHVIARIDIAPFHYWVDPTLTDQAGSLDYRALPEYGWALPIEAGSTALQPVTNASVESSRPDQPPTTLFDVSAIGASGVSSLLRQERSTSRTEMRILESFTIGEPGAPAELTVKSTYSGLAADGMRAYLRETPPEQVGKHLLNFRSKIFSGLKLVANPTWAEDRRLNQVTVEHRYQVAELWRKETASPVLRAEFYPLHLQDYVAAPETMVRTAPYALPFPLHVVCETDLHLTKPWPVTTEHRTVTDAAFEGRFGVTSSANTVNFRYEFTTLKDMVEADRMKEFAAKLQEFRGKLGYSLTFDPDIAQRNATFRFNWIQPAVAALSLLAWSMLAVWIYRRPWHLHAPPSVVPSAQLTGLNGWLILLGLGLFFRPFEQAIMIGTSNRQFLDLRIWESISGTVRMVQLVEMVAQLGLLVGSILILIAFLRRRSSFPVVFVGHFVAFFLFVALDRAVAANISNWGPADTAEAIETLVKLGIGGCIWIPYMFLSRRVKATFTSHPNAVHVPAESPPLVAVQ